MRSDLLVSLYLIEVITKYPDGTPKINKTAGVLSKIRSMFKLGPKRDDPAETQKKLFKPIIADNEGETSSSSPKLKHL